MTNKLYKLMNWPAIEEVIYSEASNPHGILGPHASGSGTLLQAFFPGAESVQVQFLHDMSEKEMELADEDGFFALYLPKKKIGAYQYIITYPNGNVEIRQDAYRHAPLFTEADEEAFSYGIHYTIYEKLGAHPMTLDGEEGTYFAVWAPNAVRVSAVGDFNAWDGRMHQMRKLKSGIFEIFVPGAKTGDNYKFELKVKGGLTYLKADPYGNAAQLRPQTASVITDIKGFCWEDDEWLFNRHETQRADAPMSVYELYLGSFAKADKGEEFANYKSIAHKLVKYVTDMGYTHVEIMPVMEHPFDASWGYQTIGYYAPTSRYGTPKDFMYLINALHKANIGVILDWVPAYFPRDTHGLASFDGTCLYEHFDERQGLHVKWDTLLYNYGRKEVSNYLIANALFWIEKYHVDGLRMASVSSMLYLDYDKEDGEWVANIYGGNENLEAIEFIKHVNSIMKKRNPGVLSIAEESTAWPMLTSPLEEEGLGFDLKWNNGFTDDFIRYMRFDPYFRSKHHSELTFSMIYNYTERFMLALSHAEMVHCKSSMIGKMPGEREQKFAGLRLAYAYIWAHPGKKLLFMGQDIAEFEEFDETRQTQWELLKYPAHKGVAALVKALNQLYLSHPALYALDTVTDGFEWINNIAADESYLAFLRKGETGENMLLCVYNFSGAPLDLQVGVPMAGQYKEILNTDAKAYGGTGVVNGRMQKAAKKEWDERPYSISLKLAPLSASIWEYRPCAEK